MWNSHKSWKVSVTCGATWSKTLAMCRKLMCYLHLISIQKFSKASSTRADMFLYIFRENVMEMYHSPSWCHHFLFLFICCIKWIFEHYGWLACSKNRYVSVNNRAYYNRNRPEPTRTDKEPTRNRPEPSRNWPEPNQNRADTM